MTRTIFNVTSRRCRFVVLLFIPFVVVAVVVIAATVVAHVPGVVEVMREQRVVQIEARQEGRLAQDAHLGYLRDLSHLGHLRDLGYLGHLWKQSESGEREPREHLLLMIHVWLDVSWEYDVQGILEVLGQLVVVSSRRRVCDYKLRNNFLSEVYKSIREPYKITPSKTDDNDFLVKNLELSKASILMHTAIKFKNDNDSITMYILTLKGALKPGIVEHYLNGRQI
ncbi:unnamed protein product [Leptidea sinapis]|uniref:Uncharacterized protein n=1 Tax=Leptidea sinapis TaxID=189913 RepID=A0A5E4PYM9_9NEOP|nr:unnamed protein product [Leptidea sinapis]